MNLRQRERPAPAPLGDWRTHLETVENAAVGLGLTLAALSAIVAWWVFQ